MSFLNIKPAGRRGPYFIGSDECGASIQHIDSKGRGPQLVLYVGEALWSTYFMTKLRRATVRLGVDDDCGMIQIAAGEDFPVRAVGKPVRHYTVTAPVNRLIRVRDKGTI